MPHVTVSSSAALNLTPRRALAPTILAASLVLGGCLSPGTIAETGDTDTAGVDQGETTAVSETADESTSTSSDGETTGVSEGVEATSGETTGETTGADPLGALPFDTLACPTGVAVELLVPGRAYLVASDTVHLSWRASDQVAKVQVWLSSDGGETYPYLVDVVSIDGPGVHVEPWDSTAAKLAVADAEGDAKPAGYRMAIAAYNKAGALVGCSEGAESFEIRGWPDAAHEVVADVWLPDPLLDMGVSVQTNPLELASKITNLGLSNYGFANLDGLAHFVGLESLLVASNAVGDVAELSWMSELRTLRADHGDLGDADLTLLGTLVSLRSLDLGANDLTDASIAALPPLPALEVLSLTDNQLTDASVLHAYPALTELRLDGNYLSTPSGLPLLPSLEVLSLADNQLKDVTYLPASSTLRSLSLASNLLGDITGLPALPELTELDLRDNDLTDAAKIAEYKGLTRLILANNNIMTGVMALADLPALHELSLAGNSNIPCANQIAVRDAILAKDPSATIELSAFCK